MTAAHSEGRCWCPACVAGAGLRLLARNRPDMAARLMADLPGRIAAAMDEAYERGRKAGARGKPPRPAVPAGGSGRPSFKRQARELLDAADRLGVARVAQVLGVEVADLLPLFAGVVEVSRTAMAKLRREAADGVPF